ncbi:hypothetical protein HID58_088009, partial [Brassica napus]
YKILILLIYFLEFSRYLAESVQYPRFVLIIMGNISELPEDLLLRILSFVPTEYIVSTSLVSERWRSLWTKVSRLTYEAPRVSAFTSASYS